MDFQSLLFSALHKVSCSPTEPAAHVLVASDIVLHLPALHFFASQCSDVVEFGVRSGESTVALVGGCKGRVRSFDIAPSPIKDLFEQVKLPCSSWSFTLGDTGLPGLFDDETDMIFFDTAHTRKHLEKELRHYGRKARKYLAFHDVVTCGVKDVSGPDPNEEGIQPAIDDFLKKYPKSYSQAYFSPFNNGLLVLKRES